MKKLIENRLGIALILSGLVIAYELLTDVFGILDPFLFRGLSEVMPVFGTHYGMLLKGLVSSLGLLVPAYVLATFSGISLGVLIGLKKPLRKNITPFINAFSAVPAPLLTPFAIHIFPSFKAASIFIIFLGAFWPTLGTTVNAVMTIDKRYLENAATLEIGEGEKLFRVILPAASPTILSGCTIALKFSFVMLVVAEMFGATSGMGYFVQYYSDFARFDLVIAGFIFMSLVLVGIMYLFDIMKVRMLRWTINN
ncbi:ABC transporter permease [Desulfosporosinus youngiae]|uniref:ABC-type nitrate/sulfonate/bicarbonate transport system, permease component n=1 Tax=Desulfosporosinus youngiae DSM 17734 TaxID=768710 RepID=H5Y343_9FIRM|nr:ABC transporter permease subunit [Desulfosporosinus youngiae]EHQ88738.1 ABC-type nitrate/sulfonate/bicarbonate transport system, permease component [Desulfosporosinus youngiae DSM 17734]